MKSQNKSPIEINTDKGTNYEKRPIIILLIMIAHALICFSDTNAVN